MIDTQRAYPAKAWREAAEAAEVWEKCPTDIEENTPGVPGQLGAWLCNEVYDNKVAGEGDNAEEPSEGVVYAAVSVLKEDGRDYFSPAEFLLVLSSYRGETVDDFRALAEEYADEIGAELMFLGAEPTEDDYRKWYTERGVAAGEVYGETQPGGTLVWFDKNKW